MLYFTSDQHFFHKNIIKYCNRPFIDINNMNTEIIRRYNHIISDEDTVIHIGDISAGLKGRYDELTSIIKKLNGSKHLILGNHDHLSIDKYIEMGFETVKNYMEYEDYFINHYPLIENTKYTTSEELKLNEIFKKTKCNKIIHGHSHNIDFGYNRFNVCVDLNNFLPVSIEDIKTEMSNIEIRTEKNILG